MGDLVGGLFKGARNLIKDTGGNLGNLVKDTGGNIGRVVGGPVGNLVKDTTGNVGNLVKDTTSSPLGQAALLAGGAYLAAPYIFGSGATAGTGAAAGSSGVIPAGASAGGTAFATGGGGAAYGNGLAGATGAGSLLPGALGASTFSGFGTGATTMATDIFSKLGEYGSSILDFAKANPQLAGSLLGALGGGLSAANAPKSQTATTSIDPQIKAEYLANLERAKAAAVDLQPRQFEGFTPGYLQAEQQITNLGLGGKGQQTIDETTRRAMIEAGFTPQQIQSATAGNTALANAQGYTAQQIQAAQANRGNVANVSSLDGSRYISAYQNPYEQQVVQGALGDIERSRQMQEQANMAQATASKAFGGSRQGIVSGSTNEAALRQAATTSGQLRSAGFTQAAQLGQNDAARQLQAQLANQGVDVTLEQANAQLRQQAGLSNQSAFNQAAQFGAGAINQANLTNAAALNQTGQFNAQLAQQAALANQNAYAQGAGIRQSAIGQLGQLGSLQQNLGLTGSNAVMDAQARQQALAQARLDAQRNAALERLQITSGALGLQPANTGGTQTTPLYNSPLGSALGGALSGAYIGSLLR